jgi:hypothetical protein
MVNIQGINKDESLLTLYHCTSLRGMGVLTDRIDGISNTCSDWPKHFDKMIDYVGGRLIKCDLTGPEMDTYLYNRDAKKGVTAESIVTLLRLHKL